MSRYVPPRIESMGLKIFLDSSKSKHNGFGYAEFVKLYKSEVNFQNLGRAFGVSRAAVVRWANIYEEEQQAKSKGKTSEK